MNDIKKDDVLNQSSSSVQISSGASIRLLRLHNADSYFKSLYDMLMALSESYPSLIQLNDPRQDSSVVGF